jgi:hypothetical protein
MDARHTSRSWVSYLKVFTGLNCARRKAVMRVFIVLLCYKHAAAGCFPQFGACLERAPGGSRGRAAELRSRLACQRARNTWNSQSTLCSPHAVISSLTFRDLTGGKSPECRGGVIFPAL